MKAPDQSREAQLQSPNSSVATTLLATLAVIVGLWWGRTFMIPLTAGLMLAMLVMPVTSLLQRLVRIRLIATTLTLTLVLVVLGLAASAFGDQLARVAQRAPDMISLVAQQVSETDPQSDSILMRARAALRELDRAADRLSGTRPTPMIQT